MDFWIELTNGRVRLTRSNPSGFSKNLIGLGRIKHDPIKLETHFLYKFFGSVRTNQTLAIADGSGLTLNSVGHVFIESDLGKIRSGQTEFVLTPLHEYEKLKNNEYGVKSLQTVSFNVFIGSWIMTREEDHPHLSKLLSTQDLKKCKLRLCFSLFLPCGFDFQ